MKKGLSEELVKRIIDNRSGKSTINTIGRKELIGYVNPKYKMPDPNPAEPFKATVTIYDIKNGIALAKVTSNKMPEFFRLRASGTTQRRMENHQRVVGF